MAVVRPHIDQERLREVLAEETRQAEALAAFLVAAEGPGGVTARVQHRRT